VARYTYSFFISIPSHTGLYKVIRDCYERQILSNVRTYVRISHLTQIYPRENL